MANIPPLHSDTALNLALAVVASSTAPLLLLDGDLTVIAASKSFCRAFQLDPQNVPGRSLLQIGEGEWNVPQLRSLLSATISAGAQIDAYELDWRRRGSAPRRLVLNAHKLDYQDQHDVRVLLSVSDVTDARVAEKLKDDLLREKGVLLKEIQHRVANSLQIIASVLMQSARRVQSAETRTHLEDARRRVMSIAQLQHQLAASGAGEVRLRSYFTNLCATIGASMIADPNQLELNVETDDSVASSDISVSLGLIVTELVINALKHAFPDYRNGKISVGYNSKGPDWTLSVSDDGVGMPAPSPTVHVGLGTSIVNALASQLRARVKVSGADPGTRISIIHAADDDMKAMAPA